MDQLIVGAIAAAGVVGQWYVSSRTSARRDGAIDEKLRSHGARLDKHGEEIDQIRSDLSGQGAKVAALDARLNAHHGKG